ncbi:D-alanine--poly(phosphoribitol) ligase [Streptomyces mauvecolor]
MQTMGAKGTSLIRLPHEPASDRAGRPALVGPNPVTYGELTRRVRLLGDALLCQGVRPGDRVAIWMDKQPRYVEAILASLDAGCVYVPLDGGQPVGRVTTILADAEPAVVLTDGRHLDALTGAELPGSVRAVVVAGPAAPDVECIGGVRVHAWEAFTATAGDHSSAAPEPAPDDLAALLYTSGSTGVPKGVKISYRNLANFVGWARDELDVGPGDVFANHASFNFDLSTFDLFVALSSGAAVWVVEDALARDVAALAAGIREHRVTVWYSVPSILHLLTASGALTAEGAASLRYVLFAGEVYPMPQLRGLARLLSDSTALYNLYGPTETNVCSHHRVRPEDLAREEPAPIGVPISGTTLTVVDEHGDPVEEPGAHGELIVSGDCVTPGYWRRETEPAAELHRARRHATGDIVSEENGRLVYRGRKDRMVKLSGYRLELGEIEAAVLRHAWLAEAAVVVHGEGPAARLALYYTLRPHGVRPNLLGIKRHCSQYLPKYMLPHSATCLAELPRNANGKTDYRTLAALAADGH